MVNYNELSDFEINKAVATTLGLQEWSEQWLELSDRDENMFLVASDNSREVLAKDYCNNWADAGPVIADNHISLELDEGCYAEAYWLQSYANEDDERIRVVHENPLRAAMVCFLKLKDAENDR